MSDPVAAEEVERKLAVHGLYVLPDLVGVGPVAAVSEPVTVTLDASYHDTSDLRLAREGITLRRRSGGGDQGWHLKLPASTPKQAAAGIRARQELHLPLDAAPIGEPPAGLVDLVRTVVRHDPVLPVATLVTVRTARLLRDDAGEVLAELVDDTVSVLGPDGQVAARFRELELEDRPGVDPSLVQPVVEALIAAGATTAAYASKAAHALGPAAGAPSEVPPPDPATPADPARAAVQAHLRRHVRALRAADRGVRRDQDDAVHQMRVAARRLRSGLRVFRPLLDRDAADALRADLQQVASTLGAYRDAEVLLERFERHLDTLPPELPVAQARTLLRRRLRRQMTAARKDALAMLDDSAYLALHERLVAACADPPTTERAQRPAQEVLPPLVRRAWKRLAQGAELLLADEAEQGAPDTQWHETRILAKKARYAVEACAPVFGAPAQALAERLAEVTDVLGTHQDSAVARAALYEVVTGSSVPAPVAFTLGVLHEVEREAGERDRSAFATLWAQARRRRYRRWLEP